MSMKKKVFIGLGVAFVLFSAWNFYVGYTQGVKGEDGTRSFNFDTEKNSRPKLFKDIYFGTKKDQITSDFNTYDCSDQFESGSICSENAFEFLGYTWRITEFGFVRDKLVYINLIMLFEQEALQTVLKAVATDHILAALQGPTETTDLIAMRKKYTDEQQFMTQLTAIEQFNLLQGNCKYMLMDKAKTIQFKDEPTLQNIVAAMDKDVREVDVSVYQYGNDTVLSVLFSIPKMGLEVYNQSQQKAVKENF